MAAPQWLRLLIGTVVIAAYASPGSAAESDWPCIQHKVDKLSSAQMWDGSPVESLTEWRGDPAIKKLVPILTNRRIPIERAGEAIDQFAASLPEEKRDQALMQLFAAVLDATNRDRAIIMAGIERFQRRQRERAANIERESAELRKLKAENNVAPAKLAEAEDAYNWDVRVFSERQQSIPLACEVPVIIEQRLFAIAREIRARMSE